MTWIIDALLSRTRWTQSKIPVLSRETVEWDPAALSVTDDPANKRTFVTLANGAVTSAAVLSALEGQAVVARSVRTEAANGKAFTISADATVATTSNETATVAIDGVPDNCAFTLRGSVIGAGAGGMQAVQQAGSGRVTAGALTDNGATTLDAYDDFGGGVGVTGQSWSAGTLTITIQGQTASPIDWSLHYTINVNFPGA